MSYGAIPRSERNKNHILNKTVSLKKESIHCYPDILIEDPSTITKSRDVDETESSDCDIASNAEIFSIPKPNYHASILTPVDTFLEAISPPTRFQPSESIVEPVGRGLAYSSCQRTSSPAIVKFTAPGISVANDISQREEKSLGEKEVRKLSKFSKQQWGALAGVCYLNMISNSSISILSSFFSKEAIEHGTSQFEIGLIFGCYAIVTALFCPIYGYLIPVIGAKSMCNFGMGLAGICSFMFSQLFRITSSRLFVACCFLCRAAQALGCAAYFTGTSVVLAQEWRTRLTFAIGVLEIFTGLGMIIGPMIGGWLYEIGGFQLPFIAIGLAMLAGVILNYYLISETENDNVTSGNFVVLFRIPNVLVTTIFMILMWGAMDFNMPVLSLEMQPLNASPVVVGSMFLIMAVAYTVMAPIIGLLGLSNVGERCVMILGGIFVGFSFLLIGPSPIFSYVGLFEQSFATISISMVFLGCGLSIALVPTFNDLTNSVIKGGMKDDITTAGIVGGIFNSATFLGEFLGPTIGGAMMNFYDDFKLVSSLYASVIFILVSLIAVFYFFDWKFNPACPVSKKKENEKSSLLST